MLSVKFPKGSCFYNSHIIKHARDWSESDLNRLHFVVVQVHVGKPVPWVYDDITDIIEAQADGHELMEIYQQYPNLLKMMKHGKSSPIQRWFGSDAQYAASCFRCR